MAFAELFENELNKRIMVAGPGDRITRAEAERAIQKLYIEVGCDPPPVIWCQSLYQMTILPSLFIGLLHSDLWQVACTILDEFPHGPAWEEQYQEAWEGLWAHGGYQLFRGIRATSRLGSQYEHLETPLLRRCRDELRDCFHDGKLKRFEENLSKEAIYRTFWAPHLWQPVNTIVDRWRQVTGELESILVRDEHVNELASSHFIPYKERLRRMYNASCTSVASMVGTMGAEPAGQLANAIYLPISTGMTSVAKMWKDHVNPLVAANLHNEIEAWNTLSENAFAIVGLEHLVFACEKPVVFAIDEAGRLHDANGPAVKFQDGFTAYFWHGVPVEARIIEEAHSITIEEIETATNIELRRVLVERYGQPRYLHNCGAVQVHEDDFGVLYRKEIKDDEPLVMVKVINSTAEPDGTFKEYFLRVPPWVETARDGVGWTFGFDGESYEPQIET